MITTTTTTLLYHESHAKKAAKRTKYKQLYKYIKLCDKLINNSLISLVINQSLHFLSILNHDQDSLFEIELNIDYKTNQLIFKPLLNDLQTNIENEMDKIIKITLNNKQLLSDSLFQIYTQHMMNNTMTNNTTTAIKNYQFLLENQHYIYIKNSIKESLTLIFSEIALYAKTFEHVKNLYYQNITLDINQYKQKSVIEYSKLMDQYHVQLELFNKIQDYTHLKIIKINTKLLKEKLIPSANKCLSELSLLLPQVALDKTNQLLIQLKDLNQQINIIPSTVEEFIHLMEILVQIQDVQDEIAEKHQFIDDLYQLIHTNNIEYSIQDKLLYDSLNSTLSAFKTSLLLAEASINTEMEHFIQRIK